MHYKKPAITFEQQIEKLERRGLQIEDKDRALRWLSRVSYYRLSAYFLPFQAEQDVFNRGATLTHVCDLYNFDRKLRLLLLDAIERIEVALRTSLTYEIGHRHGPFGHTERTTFTEYFRFEEWLVELRDAENESQEKFVEHFRQKYTRERHLPIWMASELLSFGCLSRIFKGLNPTAKRAIAVPFGATPDVILGSWLHTLSVVRNVCAHHARLWNREFGVVPKIPPAPISYFPFSRPAATGRIYATLLVIHQMLKAIAPHSQWTERVVQLFQGYRAADLKAMGIPDGALAAEPWTKPLTNDAS
jgi:abortive infection bacteriophage resistance protein